MEEIRLNPGPQTQASLSPATVVVFGGAKGGGKSFFAILEAAKYADDPQYGAVIFRKTYAELVGTGSLWEISQGIYPYMGATPNKSELAWYFPSGCRVGFSHLEDQGLQKVQGKSVPCIIFDEGAHFPERSFWWLFAQMRSMSSAPRKFIITCNPSKTSWIRGLIDWWLDEDGFPLPERSGVVRWFGRKPGVKELQWYDSREQAERDGVRTPTSFTFVASKLTDNPKLLEADPDYLGRLEALPATDRLIYLEGCWNAENREPGDLFQRTWCPVLRANRIERVQLGQPLDGQIRDWIWSVDLASTAITGDTVPGCPLERSVSAKTFDPDWSCILQWARFPDGKICLWNCYMYRDGPHQVLWMLRKLVEAGHRPATVVMPQDPGQQGKFQISSYQNALRGAQVRVETMRPINPVVAAELCSKEVASGRVWVREEALGLDRYWEQMELYPSKGVHDDAVSATALGILYDLSQPLPVVGNHFAIQRDTPGAMTANDIRYKSGRQTLNDLGTWRDKRQLI